MYQLKKYYVIAGAVLCNICKRLSAVCVHWAADMESVNVMQWVDQPSVTSHRTIISRCQSSMHPRNCSSYCGTVDLPGTENRFNACSWSTLDNGQCNALHYNCSTAHTMWGIGRSGNRWCCISTSCIVQIAHCCIALHCITLHCMSTLDIVLTRTRSSWFSSAVRFGNMMTNLDRHQIRYRVCKVSWKSILAWFCTRQGWTIWVAW